MESELEEDPSPLLRPYGFGLVKRDWIQSQHSAGNRDPESIAHSAMALDLRVLASPGCGSLPFAVAEARAARLQDAALVQVEDVVNIAHHDGRDRKAANAPSRCLKLALTDGTQDFSAVEHMRIPEWTLDSLPPGAKLLLRPGALLRRGQFLLTPQTAAVAQNHGVANPWGEARWRAMTRPPERGPGVFARLAADSEADAPQHSGPADPPEPAAPEEAPGDHSALDADLVAMIEAGDIP